jgi:hypothetical protein
LQTKPNTSTSTVNAGLISRLLPRTKATQTRSSASSSRLLGTMLNLVTDLLQESIYGSDSLSFPSPPDLSAAFSELDAFIQSINNSLNLQLSGVSSEAVPVSPVCPSGLQCPLRNAQLQPVLLQTFALHDLLEHSMLTGLKTLVPAQNANNNSNSTASNSTSNSNSTTAASYNHPLHAEVRIETYLILYSHSNIIYQYI